MSGRGRNKTIPYGPCANLNCEHKLHVSLRCSCDNLPEVHSIFHDECNEWELSDKTSGVGGAPMYDCEASEIPSRRGAAPRIGCSLTS
jgi:hypothetical protein